MQFVTPENLATYLTRDPIAELMAQEAAPADGDFASHRWLKENPAKRLIFHEIYGDLLREEQPPKRILDVGGGFTCLSRRLIRHHDYHLLDIMAHDSADRLHALEEEIGSRFWIPQDWYLFEPQKRYDVVIANDLFPNVDQRLALFLEKMLPITDSLRLSLTFYNNPRFYPTKRLDGDEVLYYLAWDGDQVMRVLEKFSKHLNKPIPLSLRQFDATVFPNKRQVIMLELHAQVACT